MGNYGHDPVTAIVESEAEGEVAEIFADIRATMGIPMLTSIWRTLVAVDGGLAAGWAAAKPLYLSGQPAIGLDRVLASAKLPVLEPLGAGQLACVGVKEDEASAVRAIIDAYNRSNGMNMLALTALFVTPAPASEKSAPAPFPPPWPMLRPLLSKAEISRDTWKILQSINSFGGGSADGGLATLLRHLAHWPGLLALIHASLGPAHRTGELSDAMRGVHELAQIQARELANFRCEPVVLPTLARGMIKDYVAVPEGVARMVTIGHALASWLGVERR